jgi:hypothetical protein
MGGQCEWRRQRSEANSRLIHFWLPTATRKFRGLSGASENFFPFNTLHISPSWHHKPSCAMARITRSKTALAEPQTSATASTPLDSQPPTKKNSKRTRETDEGEDEPQAEKKVLLNLLYFI